MANLNSEPYHDPFRVIACSVCGKDFVPAVNNIYKGTRRVGGVGSKQVVTIHQCSYSCYRKSQKDPRTTQKYF